MLSGSKSIEVAAGSCLKAAFLKGYFALSQSQHRRDFRQATGLVPADQSVRASCGAMRLSLAIRRGNMRALRNVMLGAALLAIPAFAVAQDRARDGDRGRDHGRGWRGQRNHT